MMDELRSHLVEAGMDSEEATAYLHLTKHGRCTAAQLAASIGLSRAKAYRQLEALTAKGHAVSGLGRPRTFAPAPGEVVLRALRARTESRLRRILEAESALLPRLESLASSDPAGGPHFTVVRGLDALTAAAQAVCQDADQSIDLLFAHQGGRTLLQSMGHLKTLDERGRKGVQVRLLLGKRSGQARLKGPGTLELRHFESQVLATCLVADGREALVVVAADGAKRGRSEQALGFRTDSSSFVALQQVVFNQLWSLASHGGPNASQEKPF